MAVTTDLYNLNLLVKLMVLPHHILFNVATAAIAEAILMWISADQEPSLRMVAPRYLKVITSSNFWPVKLILHWCWLSCWSWSCFSTVLTSSPYESVGQVLKFTFAAIRNINVFSELWVAYGPATNGDGCVVVMECLLHDILQEQVEQDGWE